MYQDEMRCKKCEDANDPAKLRSEIEALRKQNAKNEDDAARYRWLREKGGAVWHIVDDPKNPKRATGAYYDAAVDDAMKTPNVEFSGTPAASSPEAPLERRVRCRTSRTDF